MDLCPKCNSPATRDLGSVLSFTISACMACRHEWDRPRDSGSFEKTAATFSITA